MTCTCNTNADADEARKRQAEHLRMNPIYGTNLQRPLSEIIKELRNRMVFLRGGIADFQFGYPGWKERTEPVEGLLTCGIVTLWNVVEELEKLESEGVTGKDKHE